MPPDAAPGPELCSWCERPILKVAFFSARPFRKDVKATCSEECARMLSVTLEVVGSVLES